MSGSAWEKGFEKGQQYTERRIKEADMGLQLAIFGYEELSELLELDRMAAARKIMGNFGLIGDILKKQRPNEYIKLIMDLAQRFQQIEALLTSIKLTLVGARRPAEQQRDVLQTYCNFFAPLYSVAIGFMRTKDTMVSADTELPSLVPEAKLRESREKDEEGKADFTISIKPKVKGSVKIDQEPE